MGVGELYDQSPRVTCPICNTDKHMFNTYSYIVCKNCRREWVLDDTKKAQEKWVIQ